MESLHSKEPSYEHSEILPQGISSIENVNYGGGDLPGPAPPQ